MKIQIDMDEVEIDDPRPEVTLKRQGREIKMPKKRSLKKAKDELIGHHLKVKAALESLCAKPSLERVHKTYILLTVTSCSFCRLQSKAGEKCETCPIGEACNLRQDSYYWRAVQAMRMLRCFYGYYPAGIEGRYKSQCKNHCLAVDKCEGHKTCLAELYEISQEYVEVLEGLVE